MNGVWEFRCKWESDLINQQDFFFLLSRKVLQGTVWSLQVGFFLRTFLFLKLKNYHIIMILSLFNWCHLHHSSAPLPLPLVYEWQYSAWKPSYKDICNKSWCNVVGNKIWLLWTHSKEKFRRIFDRKEKEKAGILAAEKYLYIRKRKNPLIFILGLDWFITLKGSNHSFW